MESTFSVQRPEGVDRCLSNSHYLIFGMKRSFCYCGEKDCRDMSINREQENTYGIQGRGIE